jgi:hypothetical protein
VIELGLFDKIFPKNTQEQKQVQSAMNGYFQTLTAYTPSFTTFDGGIYEMELTRACVDRYATFCSKLKPEIQGTAYKNLEKVLQYKPNPYMNTSQFLYRIATILKVNTTAFIIPLYADDYMTITGFYPILPTNTELIDVGGDLWLRYRFTNGQVAAIEYSKVGVLTRYTYKNDLLGDGNNVLMPTMNLLDTQKQGIIEGVKQSAYLRFMARFGQVVNDEIIAKERKNFSETNLSADNKSGLMMFDSKYAEVKQIDSKPFVIDAEQMKLVQDNVFNYFGINEDILQNKYDENKWNAYYEGEIEPFAIQLSLVLTNMLFTSKEIAFNNAVMFTANRLQYASNTTKLQVSSQMFDRGILTTNQVMDIWNMAPVENGDKRYIRKEYTEITLLNDNKGEGVVSDAVKDQGQGVSSTTDVTDTDTGQAF